MIKNEIAKTTYYYGTVQKCYEKDCKEILIYLKKVFPLPFISFLLIKGSTLLLNTTKKNVKKV